MIRRLIILLIFVGCVFAQEFDVSELNNTEKMMLYTSEKKSPAWAVVYNIIPTVGYAYAGDWKRGVKFKRNQLGILLIGGATYTNIENAEDFANVFTLISLSILQIYEFIDVAKTTTKYNDELYKNIFGEYPKWKVSIIPQYQGANLTMSYALD